MPLVSIGWEDCVLFLSQLSGDPEPPIIIGGQALMVWVDLYGDRLNVGHLAEPLASKDLDVLGARSQIKPWASRVNAACRVASIDDHTPECGNLTMVTPEGREFIVDVLDEVRPIRPKDVRAQAVPREDTWGMFWVQHPLQILQCRAHNVVKIAHKYNNDHGRAQLRAAIEVLRAFLEDLAPRNPRAALNCLKVVQSLATSRDALWLYQNTGIDFLPLLRAYSGLPDAFHSKALPRALEDAKRCLTGG